MHLARALKGIFIALFLIVTISLLSIWAIMIRMPGDSFKGELPPLTDEELLVMDELMGEVHLLGAEIGNRNVYLPEKLHEAEAHLESALRMTGLTIKKQSYDVDGVTCSNLIGELTGTRSPEEVIVVGAHYDSVMDCPGANDNGSGVAAILALARTLSGHQFDRTLRFLLFVNEEPPFFQTEKMGSMVYAGKCREEGDNVVAMLSLETIGYYRDEDGSQHYPFPLSYFYPKKGNFIAFVGNTGSGRLVRNCTSIFREKAAFPSEGAALPGSLPGIGWSDHWSFWQHGYPGIMVTDTAPFRYPHYHTGEDTPDKIDYERMTRVVAGLQHVITGLASPDGEK